EWAQANPRSLQVNGFTWERVQREGVPREVLSQHIITLLDSHQISRQNAVFLCQNPAFDASFFNQIVSATERDAHGWPYRWLDLASMELGRHQSMPLTDLTKDKIAEAYGIPPEAKTQKAKNGVDHLIAIVKRILLSQDGLGWRRQSRRHGSRSPLLHPCPAIAQGVCASHKNTVVEEATIGSSQDTL
ncbi:MAG: hypothetical protein KDK78_08720, partial [Chlamydiia bacterium]|nr:hypothetical protein [Chlamydiia bacterium]